MDLPVYPGGNNTPKACVPRYMTSKRAKRKLRKFTATQARIQQYANAPVDCCGHSKANHGDYGECGTCLGNDGPCQGDYS